ncbi:Tol-Pal system protein TolB [Candidatus Protochlamydia phocaeensis]|uniref:Tol-Pal system protein TolB n=1 Tax=Candidatus Protochlamydia phocaeensis TaxID=1414722 RepID=UPI0008396E8B|nr:Tol-Pal system protein TolB [Candidatus Protochlamydia phocaeensis]
MHIDRFKFLSFYLIGWLALSWILPLQAQEEGDTIVVRLETESPLVPLYFPPLSTDQAALTDVYARQLEQVLAFDLNHNGSTYLAKRTAENDQLALGGEFESVGSLNDWQAKNIFYVVKGQIRGKSLHFLVLDVNAQNIKTPEAIPLTGDLSQDRRLIHRFADMMHKALFGTEGIASTRILYTIKRPNSNNQKPFAEVWESDYDGANARQITQDKSFCVTPAYIPPKPGYLTGGFLYVSYQLGQPKIYVANLKDGVGHRLTYLGGNQLMPAVSQQRDKVAFISDVTGNPDLFLQPFSPETGAIGKPQQIFSAKQATQGSPTFSPDGKRIAFVSNKDGSPKIYIITIPQPGTSLKNIKATLISKQNRENSAPAWSPDGSKIAYCARSKGDRQIWIYDFETNQERQLTQGPGNKENPSWAPNSLHLVFNSSDVNDSNLYLINLNQAEAKRLTFGPGEKRFPSWEPRIK